MSDLHIPAEAEAVAHAFGVSPQILADTAPFIVAAELRRLASDYERRSDNVPLGRRAHESGAVDRVGNLREMAAMLRRRADELVGGGTS